MLAVRVWPTLFSYQTVIEATPDARASELLRGLEILDPDFREWRHVTAGDPATESRTAGD